MIKKLQNNYTTPEQSKRLLELGVPADSADCFYSHYIKTYAHSEYTEILWHRPRFITEDNIPNWNARLMDGTRTYLPCWSTGRLMEIISHCYNWNESLDVKFTGGCLGIPRYTHKDNYLGGAVGFIVREIKNAIMTNNMDFSKLEE